MPLDQARFNELCFEQLSAVETVNACLGKIWQRLRRRTPNTPPHASQNRSDPLYAMWTIPVKSFARTARLPTHLGVPGEKQPKEMSGRDLRVT